MWRFYAKRYINPVYVAIIATVSLIGILNSEHPAVWGAFIFACLVTWFGYIIIMETLKPTDSYKPKNELKDDEADAWNQIIKNLDDIR